MRKRAQLVPVDTQMISVASSSKGSDGATVSVTGECSFVHLHTPAHSEWQSLLSTIFPSEVALFHALFSLDLIPL